MFKSLTSFNLEKVPITANNPQAPQSLPDVEQQLEFFSTKTDALFLALGTSIAGLRSKKSAGL